jgi:hypothetical protein
LDAGLVVRTGLAGTAEITNVAFIVGRPAVQSTERVVMGSSGLAPIREISGLVDVKAVQSSPSAVFDSS